jgi:hypothetical protein
LTAPLAVADALPSLPIKKLVPHFGQRIFIPLSGMRRGSSSYGALQETHSTLIIALDQTCCACGETALRRLLVIAEARAVANDT